MDVPANFPEPLREALKLSDQLDGECVIFDPDDRIAYANPSYRRHYAFVEFESASYDDIYWGSIANGLFGVEELRMSPADYLAMAKVARRIHDRMDFIKRYASGNMLGCHQGMDGWSVQVRLPVDSPLWRGGFAGVKPGSLAEAAGAAEAARRMRRTLDALSTGMLFLDRAGEVLWGNVAAWQGLSRFRELEVIDGRLHFAKADAAAEFAEALTGVLQAPAGSRKFLALPDKAGGSVVCSLIGQGPDEGLLLLAPGLDGEGVSGALLGFGLSPAECRAALLTADGHSPQTVAEMTGKSVNTIRAQLSAVMKKGRDTTPASRTGIGALIFRIASVAGVAPRRTN